MDYRNQQTTVADDGTLPTVARPSRGLKLKKRVGLLRAIDILAYRGHGTANSLQIKGRLIESAGKKAALFKRNKKLYNFFTTIRSFRTNEIPGAEVEARFRGKVYRLYTDSEGFFLLDLWFPDEPLEPGWHEVNLQLKDSIGGSGATAIARSFVPPADAEFAVISDIDDTVLNSSAFDKIQQVKLTLFKDAAGRTAVEEVVPLYQKLVEGASGAANNPMFYLSRSGWNLNKLLEEFLDLNKLPPGPMFLRDLAWGQAKSLALGSNNHKIDYIRELLNTYPHLPFVLIGDSGQHDPETFWQIAVENPGRIKAVYLHDLERKSRIKTVATICNDLRERGVAVVHSNKVASYAKHMEDLGLIKSSAPIGN